MTEETMNDPRKQAEPAPADDAAADPSPEALAEEEGDAADPVAALETERAELKDRLLRTLAEMENLRRRTLKDVSDAKNYAVTAFARDMLTVVDNLNRAIQSAPPEAVAEEGPLKALLDGVILTERDFIKTLERHGVKRLEPEGQKFDPHFHQAIFEAPNPAIPSGHVATVMQAGFAIGERVLRPALVGVSKGPAKEAQPNGAERDPTG